VGADALLILTDVPQAYVNYGTPEQQALATVTLAEMRAFAAAGHFKAGSMGPKVKACMRFVEGGGTAVIGSLTEVVQAMDGKAGTRIVAEPGAMKMARRTPREGAKKAGGKTHGKKSDGKKGAAKRAAAGKPARPGATVIDISEARKRVSGGTA
jgi:glutamate 5-kinase